MNWTHIRSVHTTWILIFENLFFYKKPAVELRHFLTEFCLSGTPYVRITTQSPRLFTT